MFCSILFVHFAYIKLIEIVMRITKKIKIVTRKLELFAKAAALGRVEKMKIYSQQMLAKRSANPTGMTCFLKTKKDSLFLSFFQVKLIFCWNFFHEYLIEKFL